MAGIARIMTPEDDLEDDAVEKPVLSLEAIDNLITGTDAEFAAELMDNFRQIGNTSADGFFAAAEKNDRELMTRHAHNLKNSAAIVGLMRLTSLCRKIELACTQGLFDEACDVSGDLRAELERGIQALSSRPRISVRGPET